jgi:hypothetical protein
MDAQGQAEPRLREKRSPTPLQRALTANELALAAREAWATRETERWTSRYADQHAIYSRRRC